MKIETFFEKFALFADAPAAVEKMRALLLNFAVTGRLSEQRAGDASVSDLIDALSAAKAQRGKMRRRGVVAADSPESVIDRPLDIPAHWAWVPLNEIGAMSGGMTPSKDKSAFWNGDVNWFSSKDIKLDELTESELKITREATEATGLQVYAPGCLVMVARSGILKRTFPVSILRSEGTVNQDLKVLSPFVTGIERYLQIMLRGMTGFILTELVKTGMTVQSLKYEEFEAQPFPLPPFAEQKRIVAKVDELMALCDRLEAQQHERDTRHTALARASLTRFADAPTPANLNFLFHPSYSISPADLRKSILTLAVEGKLVPQDPNDDDPEAALLELHRLRIRQAKTGKLRTAKVPANAFLEDSLPFIPDSWRTVSFDHLAVVHNNALKAGPFGSALKKEFYVEKGYKIYGQEQVIAGDPFIGDYYIDEKKFVELESCAVSTGDILISLVGTIGKILVLPDGIEPGIINPRVIKLSLDASLVYPMFIKILIGSPYAVDFFEKNSHGGTMNILNLSILRALPLPLPPIAEQRRIVAKVDQLMALVDELEAQLAASRASAANLLSALVAELTGIPDGRVTSPASAKLVAASPRPNLQKATVAAAKPATQESTVSPCTLAGLRKAAGLTQAAVAEAMGLNQANISQMETGKRSITVEQREKMFKIFALMPK